VTVVARAEQLAEFRPVEKRRRCRVRRDEALAIVLHEREQIGLLLRIQRHVPMAEKEDRIHIGQVGTAAGRLAVGHQRMFRDDVGVGANERVVEARLVAESLDDRQRVRDGVVLRDAVARVGPGEHGLARAWGRAAAAAAPALSPPARRILHASGRRRHQGKGEAAGGEEKSFHHVGP
jgi:hypothetical protein